MLVVEADGKLVRRLHLAPVVVGLELHLHAAALVRVHEGPCVAVLLRQIAMAPAPVYKVPGIDIDAVIAVLARGGKLRLRDVVRRVVRR